ncbi:nuclear transport factor 2 family protein [Enterobacter sp. RHBSTW-00994]|uniref:nuclear transport factor 2 family protein n=1 Tax=Enterobacter sp. RHBSTW-00994 TaxID=2742676 RepID=UPI001C677453|nr:nuclear transport factor 2 family protein [Enterobacter sp. RHBSTW-00994]
MSINSRSVKMILVGLLAMVVLPVGAQTQTSEQAISTALKTRQPLDVVNAFLMNTAPDKVSSAAQQLVAPDATYISLNFNNPELKKIEPWAGTSKGPEAFVSTFSRVAKYWKIVDFTVEDIFASGDNVAVFGNFTYRSTGIGKQFNSPFSIHAKVKAGKITYFQFMEDTYASASSFRVSGDWEVKTDPDGASYRVGE